ncbi:MAG TPA: hypothetical protein VIQ01_01730 [Burkholderiales bacterium]
MPRQVCGYYGVVPDEPLLLDDVPLPLPISEDDDGGVLGSAGVDGLGMAPEPLMLESGAVVLPGLRAPGVPVAPVPPLDAPGSVRGSWTLSPQAARPPMAKAAAAAIKVFFI